MNKVITIGRQYGSGGREIGQKLAKYYDIPFYDNELITRAAKESGFAEETFEKAEDKATNSLLYSLAMGINVYGNQDFGFSGLSLDDRIFLAQSDVIRKVADEGPCVIVGRCADYVLKNEPNIIDFFISGNTAEKKKRILERYDIEKNKAEDFIRKTDKRRASYYNYYTDMKWGEAKNYDLCINSSKTGVDGAIKLMKAYIEIKEANADK